jgi:hypothetical protein
MTSSEGVGRLLVGACRAPSLSTAGQGGVAGLTAARRGPPELRVRAAAPQASSSWPATPAKSLGSVLVRLQCVLPPSHYQSD